MSYIDFLYGVKGMKKGTRKQYVKHPRATGPGSRGGKAATPAEHPRGKSEPEHPIGKQQPAGPEHPTGPIKDESGDVVAPRRGPLSKSQITQNKIQNSVDRQNQIKSDISAIHDKISNLKGKKNKAAREKLQKQAKDLQTKAKAESDMQKGLRQQKSFEAKGERETVARQKKADRETAKAQKKANAAQVKASKLAMKKAAAVVKQADKIAAKIQNAELKAKLKEIAAQAKASSAAHQNIISGIQQPAAPAALHEHYELSEKGKFVAWRTLTTQEQRVDWHSLNTYYNEQQSALKSDLIGSVREDLDSNIKKIQNRLKAGDIAGIAAVAIISANKINAILNKYIKNSYEQGKNMAAKELKVPKPVTPTIKTQLMNLDSSMIAEKIATDVDLAAKQKARDGFAKNVSTSAIVASVVAAAQKKAAQGIAHAVGNVIGENLNKGSRLVYEQNATVIQGFQRSEILDNRTCAMCEELDEQIVTADDPFAQLDEVHDNCRGRWVPIILGEEFDASSAGLPAEIEDAFDTIGGVPTVNAFTQLSKPLDDEGQAIADDAESSLTKKGG